MDEKLRILMQSENLTASKLSEILEIKPAAVSHILSGRNKPSFDLLCKIVNRFPQINPYWLLGDAPEMYNMKEQNSTSENLVTSTGTLFAPENGNVDQSANSNISQNCALPLQRALSKSNIDRIIIVYQDQTFEELRPKK